MDIKQVKDIKLNFILAAARTGSTLLSSMLNMHPNVISPTEEPFAYYLYPKYKSKKIWTSRVIDSYCYDFYLFARDELKKQFSTKKDLKEILEKYKKHLDFNLVIKLTYLCFYPDKNKSEITMVADKQLEFHANLEFVAKMYPKSKFIILYRDPRDQVLSRYKMVKKKDERQKSYIFLAYVWKHKYNALLKKAVEIGVDRFLEIKYENLILNPENELRRICAFFDISYYNVMLKYDEHFKEKGKNPNITEDDKQKFLSVHSGLLQKVNSRKIGVWKQELNELNLNLIWTICGDLAEKIGYTRQGNFNKQNVRLKDFPIVIDFFIKNKILPKIYHPSPFFIKYFIVFFNKKIMNKHN